MRGKVKRGVLLALGACNGMPMPEAALVSAVQLLMRPLSPTESDVAEGLKDVEADGYVLGATDDIMGRSWTLTEKGVHKARQLR